MFLYLNNYHDIMWNGRRYQGFVFETGVKQGCPLSAIIFIFVFEFLLRRLLEILPAQRSVLAAVADDIGIVGSNLFHNLPIILNVMEEWRLATCMALSLSKCVLIPLWEFDEPSVAQWLLSNCPPGRRLSYQTVWQILGAIPRARWRCAVVACTAGQVPRACYQA